MAINNESVTVATCDACGRRTYGEPGEAPRVLSGKVKDMTSGSEKNADWSACGPGHVGKAVGEALKRASESRHAHANVVGTLNLGAAS